MTGFIELQTPSLPMLQPWPGPKWGGCGRGRAKDTIPVFQSALKAEPNNASGHYSLGPRLCPDR